MTNINDLLREHVTLTVECLDRSYLNGYIPTLQTTGQLVNFLIYHRVHKIPSPVLLGRITQAFARAVKSFAQKNDIPLIRFERGQRKDDVAADYRKKFDRSEGVVFKDRVRSLTIRSHNLDQNVIRDLNRVITGFAHYFATPFSTVKNQFFDLDAWIRMRLRCMKFKRISRGDDWRFLNKRFARMGLVSLYSFAQ